MPKKSYDALKEHEGKRYTGMQIGRGHKWNYDAGQWVEKKVTPDKWEFQYSVVKRRKGRAPEGSGAPVGTLRRSAHRAVAAAAAQGAARDGGAPVGTVGWGASSRLLEPLRRPGCSPRPQKCSPPGAEDHPRCVPDRF